MPRNTANPPETITAEGEARQHTRDALLDAAEVLFSELGVDGASLRAITARAGANLAAVSYHFGNKEGLVRAVFNRRLRPINEERLRRLTALEDAASPEAPDPEGVLRAFLEPVVRFGQESSEEQMRFRKLMGRTFAEPGEVMRQRLRDQFQEVGDRFPRALARAFPGLEPGIILWRFHFMIGSMVQVALHGALIAESSGGACDPTHGEEVIGRLVEFLLAGFQAPSTGASGGKQRPSKGEASTAAPAIFAWEEGF